MSKGIFAHIPIVTDDELKEGDLLYMKHSSKAYLNGIAIGERTDESGNYVGIIMDNSWVKENSYTTMGVKVQFASVLVAGISFQNSSYVMSVPLQGKYTV